MNIFWWMKARSVVSTQTTSMNIKFLNLEIHTWQLSFIETSLVRIVSLSEVYFN